MRGKEPAGGRASDQILSAAGTSRFPRRARRSPVARGRVEDVVRKHADRFELRPRSASAFICGNPQMIDNVKGALRRGGFEGAAGYEEQYWPE